MKKDKGIKKALVCAFPQTIPIMAGFLFLGLAYGIYMNVSGFPFWYPMLMAVTIFGGSLEFIAVSMLLAPFAPLQTFLLAVLVQARHLFYGISMLEKLKGLGWKKAYLIFGLCDETFSVNYTAEIPEDVDRGWFYFWVTFLNQMYWVVSATAGGILGSYLNFSTKGLDFVLIAMFVVIFMEQWKKEKNHISGVTGLLVPVICLVIFGKDAFMIPAMIGILAVLLFLKGPIQKSYGEEGDAR